MTTTSVAERRALPAPAWIIAAWLAATVALGAAGVFRGSPGTPPIALGIVAGGPPLAVLALLLGSARFLAWARGLDLRLLTQLQMLRVGGFTLLVLGISGTLPRSFALPAGIGDVIVALTAPLIATYVVGARHRWIFAVWTAFGILDLINAVALGILNTHSTIGVLTGAVSTDAMGSLPLSLIPTFGVPLGMVLHLLSLPRLRHWNS